MLNVPVLSRQSLIVVHRWAGLTTALFLIVAGVTGILLPFKEELTLAARPSLSAVSPPQPGAALLDPVTLAERVERATGAVIVLAPLVTHADKVAVFAVTSHPDRPPLAYDEIWADPYNGAIRLKHRSGVLADGAQNIMPFLLKVHYSLALGEWAKTIFGIAAAIWLINSIIGFFLGFPISVKKRADRASSLSNWLRRWKPSWLVRAGSRGMKLHFDLHRAGGSWLWPVMLVFACAAVAFTLPNVHAPIAQGLGGSAGYAPTPLAQPLASPPVDFRAARTAGRTYMAAEAAKRNLVVEHEDSMRYFPHLGAYLYFARTNIDIVATGGRTMLWIDGRDGRLLHFEGPLDNTTTDAFLRWSEMLHMAKPFGLPYKFFVSVFALSVATVSLMGVLLWWGRRSARTRGSRTGRSATPASEATS